MVAGGVLPGDLRTAGERTGDDELDVFRPAVGHTGGGGGEVEAAGGGAAVALLRPRSGGEAGEDARRLLLVLDVLDVDFLAVLPLRVDNIDDEAPAITHAVA